tara:strand:+ start:1190 stop:1708 length:519 start_codon:yes stop_codon:yes gene_type:complete
MKKGIELSLSFLVTVIIAITIFMFGIKFIYDLTSQATELEGLTTEELDKRIGELLCESTQRVCIGLNKKEIRRGKLDVFGIKIINIDSEKNFEISTNVVGYTLNNNPISTDPDVLNKIDLKYRTTVFLGRNAEETIGLGVEVMKDAKAGTYILDVIITPYDDVLNKIYIEVP